MTSGTYSVDKRERRDFPWTSPNGDCGMGVVSIPMGVRIDTTWSGGDQPKANRLSGQQVVSYTYTLFDKRGDAAGRRTTRSKPKRYASPKDPHAYQKVVDVKIDAWGVDFLSCHSNKDYTRSFPTTTYANYSSFLQSPWGPNEDLALYGRLADRLNASFNLSVFLGEGREALQTITSAATRIHKSLKKLRKGDLRGAVRTLVKNPRGSKAGLDAKINVKDVAGRHLEWVYAVKPLLQDVFHACEHFAYMQNRPVKKTYRCSKTVQAGGDVGGVAFGGGFCPVQRVVQKSLIAHVTHINEAALLGLTNPASLAWEKLPWSFVADWFIPISNYLEACNLSSSLSGVFIMSEKSEGYCFGYRDSKANNPSVIADFQRYTMNFSRTVGSSLSRPQLPTLKPLSKIASFQHCLNAVSLIVSTFSGKH